MTSRCPGQDFRKLRVELYIMIRGEDQGLTTMKLMEMLGLTPGLKLLGELHIITPSSALIR